MGWLEAEGSEDSAKEAGIPGVDLKFVPGVRVVIGAMKSVKADGAKGDRKEETGRTCKRKKDRWECLRRLNKPEKPRRGGNAGLGLNRACGQTGCWQLWKTELKEDDGSV